MSTFVPASHRRLEAKCAHDAPAAQAFEDHERPRHTRDDTGHDQARVIGQKARHHQRHPGHVGHHSADQTRPAAALVNIAFEFHGDGIYHRCVKTPFTNQVVIVTGASTGIGRETALAFAAAGARVIAAARNASALESLGNGILPVAADVSREADVQRLVDTALERFGRVDILVNNAGVGMRAAVEDTVFADAERLMDVNFFGALRCIQTALPHMRRQGRGQIVNVGSILSVLATPRNSIYSASKFALRALSDSLRIELRGAGIDVILIMPGYTDTAFFENQMRYGGPVRVTPLRGVHPRTVATAILKACRRRQREVALTLPGKLGVFLKRWFPRLLDWTLSLDIKRRNP